uniref:BRMS1 like transcriptional repressor b n=1 Tax=Hucho hucho TaxID=62062 RepID=A0A4W5MQS5_9TELE
MPVHAREKKESNHEEMEVDFPDQDASSTDEEDTVSSSVSEDGDSSDMDDEDCERRRIECMDEMTTLEKQFGDLKEQLYKERLSQVDIKLKEVIAGCAQEYLEPLANLQENMQIRTKVAGIYRELCLESVKNKYDCEIQAACQHWESEKLLLFDTVQSELEEKIRRLEEDRHSIDITSELWNDGLHSRKNKKKDPFCPAKKKKPVVFSFFLTPFSRPYIVYMLQDLDILEDWTAIRKAMASLGPHRVKVDGKNLSCHCVTVKPSGLTYNRCGCCPVGTISLYVALYIFPPILTSLPVPAAEKHPCSMMLPPPCFTVGMVPGFLQM